MQSLNAVLMRFTCFSRLCAGTSRIKVKTSKAEANEFKCNASKRKICKLVLTLRHFLQTYFFQTNYTFGDI